MFKKSNCTYWAVIFWTNISIFIIIKYFFGPRAIADSNELQQSTVQLNKTQWRCAQIEKKNMLFDQCQTKAQYLKQWVTPILVGRWMSTAARPAVNWVDRTHARFAWTQWTGTARGSLMCPRHFTAFIVNQNLKNKNYFSNKTLVKISNVPKVFSKHKCIKSKNIGLKTYFGYNNFVVIL